MSEKKIYIAHEVDDNGNESTHMVMLDEDILLQYCLAYDARQYDTRSTIESVAAGDESLLEAILTLHKRFDLQEDFTPQLLAYRHQLVAK